MKGVSFAPEPSVARCVSQAVGCVCVSCLIVQGSLPERQLQSALAVVVEHPHPRAGASSHSHQ